MCNGHLKSIVKEVLCHSLWCRAEEAGEQVSELCHQRTVCVSGTLRNHCRMEQFV